MTIPAGSLSLRAECRQTVGQALQALAGCFLILLVVYWVGTQTHAGLEPASVNEDNVSSMPTMIEETPLLRKTRELCQTILDEPNVQSIRKRIDCFLGDQQVRAQYEGVVSKGQALHDKQQNSMPLSGEEIADYESHRDRLMSNPVARDFIDAQEEIHQIQESVQRYVSKTLELGRLPAAEEMEDHCCGHQGCGCSH